MPSNEALYQQSQIQSNSKVEFTVNGKKYRVKRPTNYISGLIGKLIHKTEFTYSEDKKEMMLAMDKNRTLIPKCISLYVLSNPIKVWLFHRFYWRWLHYFGEQELFQDMLTELFKLLDYSFFFQNLASLQKSIEVEQMIAQKDTKIIKQELKLAEQTTS